MSLVVLSYPKISPEDLRWIEGIRAEHDEIYYGVVDLHFTLVFPSFGMDPTAFVRHVEGQAEGQGRIPFALRCAVVVDDAFSEYFHTFLVPDEGYRGTVKLHDRFYRGPLAPELRLDIPYIPHVGVGNSLDPTLCKELADDLNGQDFVVEGEIDALDVARYEGGTVTTIKQIPLA